MNKDDAISNSIWCSAQTATGLRGGLITPVSNCALLKAQSRYDAVTCSAYQKQLDSYNTVVSCSDLPLTYSIFHYIFYHSLSGLLTSVSAVSHHQMPISSKSLIRRMSGTGCHAT